MKNLVIFGVGGMGFFAAALVSAGIYWFAPINPCYVSDSSGYGSYGGYGYGGYSRRETLCSGSEIHTYQIGRDVSERTGDVDFFVKFFLAMIPFGAFVLCLLVTNGIMSRIAKKKRQRQQAAAPPATGPPA